MARKPTGNPVGPPLKEISWKLFEELCGLQCTQSEMASMLNVDADTLRSRVKDNYGEDYSVVHKRLSESGHCSLRRYQFVMSEKNASMAIWLGKQWLGQKDSVTDLKELIIHELQSGLKQVSEQSRREAAGQPALASESPLSHS